MKPTMKLTLKPLQQSLLLGLVTLSLAGCQVLGPFYSRPEPQVPTQFTDGQASQMTQEQQLALQQWWTLFNDSQLTSW